MELDVQTKPLHFACFISAFQDIEGFESMPWEERAEQIATYYDIKSVCDRTLRNYCHKLLDKDLIGKVDERTCWKTEIIDSVKIRTPVQQGDKEMAEYFSRKYELINDLKRKCFSLGLRPKEANKIAWTEAMKILW